MLNNLFIEIIYLRIFKKVLGMNDLNQRNFTLYMKVNVKPVFGSMVHTEAYEGPCRCGKMEELIPEAERLKNMKAFVKFQEDIKENISPEAKILKPVYIEYDESFVVKEEEFKKLEVDLNDVDLFLLSYRVPGIEFYKKPIAMIGKGVTNVDVAAYLRSRGIEGYAPLDYNELNELISLMQVRKAVRHTKILVATGGELIPFGVVSTIWDLEGLKARYGIGYHRIHFSEIFKELEKVDQKEAEKIAEKIIRNAKKINIKENFIVNDVKFYLAVKNLMKKYGCNAFTFPCFEACSSRLPCKHRVVPCLTHTLLKDHGYPSSCEEDISVLMAMIILMYLSKKSAFMGNPSFVDEKTIKVVHSVPGLKMNGFDQPDMPYELWHFTAGGWGTKVQVNLAANTEKTVTLARFNPTATEILVTRGKVVDCEFYEVGCSPGVYIEVDNAREIIHKQIDFGHHMAMVYGDYLQKIEKLSELMKFKVVKV